MATALSNAITPNPTGFYNPSSVLGGSGSIPSAVIPGVTTATTSITQLQYLTYNPKYYMTMTIGTFQRDSVFSATVTNPTSAIVLPLPEKIQDSYSVKYLPTPLGVFVGATTQALQQSIKGSQFAGQLLTGLGIGFADAVTKGGALNAAVQAYTNYTPNEFLTILLSGPQYKQHSFMWNFAPSNFQEAQNLNNIILALQNAAAPSIVQNGLVFQFPQVFQLAFMPNSQYLFKFKPAALTNVSIDYSGTGPSFFRSGNGATDGSGNGPTNVIMKLDFLELAFWISGNWINNNDPLSAATQSTSGTTSLGNMLQNLTPSQAGIPPPSSNPTAPENNSLQGLF